MKDGSDPSSFSHDDYEASDTYSAELLDVPSHEPSVSAFHGAGRTSSNTMSEALGRTASNVLIQGEALVRQLSTSSSSSYEPLKQSERQDETTTVDSSRFLTPQSYF